MWHSLRLSPETDTDLASSIAELMQATSRTLIFCVLGIGLVLLIAAGFWLEALGSALLLIAPIVVITCLVAITLLSKRYLAAHLVWQSGLAIAITLALFLFRRPEMAFAYALLPLLATVTMGWWMGGLTLATIGLLTWMLPLSFGYQIALLLAGTVTGVLGWASTHALLTSAQWSLYSFELASRRADEALQQRVEYKQIQQDLVRANGELARLSDRLSTMQQVAEEARRAREEFVANVSHELRTPLNMIIGFSEMLLQASQVYGAALPPQVLADVAAIERNSQHLSKLVDDVLDLSQVETGRMALGKEWASMETIIHAGIEAVRALFDSKGLYLKMTVPRDLALVFCDDTRIRQVIINLLSNAGRFTETGGVLVTARQTENVVTVSVRDTGPGISEQDYERLFEPFQQLDASIRRQHGGSGLGLSISRRFVEMHGGRMWLESELDVGTTFYFSLPIDASSAADLDAGDARRWFSPYDEYAYREPARRSKAPLPSFVPRYVIQEEGETLQRLFNRYVDHVEIVAVQDGQAARRELERSPAQALIVNAPLLAEMPPSSEYLRRLPYDTPAMACWVPGEDQAAKRLGVMRYLVKPVTRDTLLSALEDLGGDVKTVLVVDDDREALQLFGRMLSSSNAGYRILRARSGQQALDLLAARHPDVMLLDLIMPGMDGFQVLQAKSRDPSIRDIPVIVVSSRDPSNEPIVSNMLSVTRGGGLSVGDLLNCMLAISETLTPVHAAG